MMEMDYADTCIPVQHEACTCYHVISKSVLGFPLLSKVFELTRDFRLNV